MSVNAVVGVGTTFKRGDGASVEVFTAVGEIQSITLPSRARPPIDVTDLDSSIREFVMGIRDNGEITISSYFSRSAYLDFNTDFESSTAVNYQIVFNDAGNTTIDLTGYVQDLGGSVPGPDEIVAVDVTIKVTGDITISS